MMAGREAVGAPNHAAISGDSLRGGYGDGGVVVGEETVGKNVNSRGLSPRQADALRG